VRARQANLSQANSLSVLCRRTKQIKETGDTAPELQLAGVTHIVLQWHAVD